MFFFKKRPRYNYIAFSIHICNLMILSCDLLLLCIAYMHIHMQKKANKHSLYAYAYALQSI